ncbi:MAG: CoB--CoM heterodisulfide reductase iron-sulfur subunit B family protein [Deltaproteobacteria bacterium]|nr:CoB--CoM heterodisulfide reductase iron-sulfur subunit B family protein [Deltaproteobacteria bacterium]
MTEYAYYPGCSGRATARGYDESLLAVAPRLGMTLTEIPDWNCCGSGLALSVNQVLSLALSARNLALAEKIAPTVVTPCPSCCLTLNKANHVLQDGGAAAAPVQSCLEAGDLKYGGGVRVRHLLDVIVNDVGVERLAQAVTAPLTGKRVAPYYGCQVVRPVAEGDDAEYPHNLEQVIAAVGGEVADFPLKTSCCGGALVATRPELGREMCLDLLRSIGAARADIVVTPCPLCQVTLEMAQHQNRGILQGGALAPVLYLTQLIGVALGLSERELGLQRALMPKTCRRALARTEQQPAL